MSLTSSISWRARLVAASRPRVATVFEFAVSIIASAPSTPMTSTSDAIITSTRVNPRSEGRRAHAKREAPIAGCLRHAPRRVEPWTPTYRRLAHPVWGSSRRFAQHWQPLPLLRPPPGLHVKPKQSLARWRPIPSPRSSIGCAPIADCVGTEPGGLYLIPANPADRGRMAHNANEAGPKARLVGYDYAAWTTRCRPQGRRPCRRWNRCG